MADISYYFCRLCAFKCSIPGLMIFSSEGMMRDISRKIEDCLRFSVSEDDEFPKIICGDCLYKLDAAHEFKTKCLEAQQYIYDLLKHQVLGNDLLTKEVLQSPNYTPFTLNDDISEQTAIQELEHLVEEAAFHSNDTTVVKYDETDIAEYQIQQTDQNIDAPVKELPKDTVSLSELTLYSFDSISDNGPKKNSDILVSGQDFETDMSSSDNVAPASVKEDINIVKEMINQIESKNGNKKAAKEKTVKQCKFCHKQLGTNYKLKEHERTHTKETPFHCTKEDCDKKFRSKIGLAQHEAKHRGQYKFACDICGKGFEIKSYLTIHLKTHNTDKPYQCSMCELRFKAKQGLIDHENRHLGLKPYQCSQCDKRFITKSLTIKHIQTHSKIVTRDHQCSVCGKLFASKSCMKMHMKIHYDDKRHICEFCGKAFLARTDLKLHETSHTGEKRYICETCGKAFNRPNSLKNHSSIHNGLRPYKCKYCLQSFTQSSPCRIHMRQHTGERPYSCTYTICTKKFISKTSLRRHLQSHCRKDQVATVPLALTNSINQKTENNENK